MSGRPLGLLPSWATDLNYAAGPAWGGTPTKVEPGAGRRATGLAPNERPPAQHWNQNLNQLGNWVDYFDAMQAQNWNRRVKAVLQTNGAVSYDPRADSGRGRWFAVGSNGAGSKYIEISSDGLEWLALGGIGGGDTDLSAVASSTTHAGGLTIMGGNGGANADRIYEYKNGAWTDHDLAGISPLVSVIFWAEEIAMFLIGGRAEGVANIWTTTDGVTYTDRTVPDTSTSVTSGVIGIAGGLLASGSNLYVAISQDIGVPAEAGASWTSPDGITWTLRDLTSPAILEPVSIAFSKEEKAFLILTAAGRVYRSTDGINWALITDTAQPFQVNCLACKGSLWIALGGAQSGEFRYTLGSDNVKWRRFSAGKLTGDVPPIFRHIAYGDGRFLALSEDASFGYYQLSMRLGNDEKEDGGE